MSVNTTEPTPAEMTHGCSTAAQGRASVVRGQQHEPFRQSGRREDFGAKVVRTEEASPMRDKMSSGFLTVQSLLGNLLWPSWIFNIPSWAHSRPFPFCREHCSAELGCSEHRFSWTIACLHSVAWKQVRFCVSRISWHQLKRQLIISIYQKMCL